MFSIFQMSSANVVTGTTGFALTVLARMLAAVLTAVVGQSFLLVRHGRSQRPKYFLTPFYFWGTILSQISCDKKSCIYCKDGHCSLTNPEKVGNECLDLEDATDFVRLKADAIKRTRGLSCSSCPK
jgi:hypothetical protein